jgi:hypothetical protein
LFILLSISPPTHLYTFALFIKHQQPRCSLRSGDSLQLLRNQRFARAGADALSGKMTGPHSTAGTGPAAGTATATATAVGAAGDDVTDELDADAVAWPTAPFLLNDLPSKGVIVAFTPASSASGSAESDSAAPAWGYRICFTGYAATPLAGWAVDLLHSLNWAIAAQVSSHVGPPFDASYNLL